MFIPNNPSPYLYQENVHQLTASMNIAILKKHVKENMYLDLSHTSKYMNDYMQFQSFLSYDNHNAMGLVANTPHKYYP